MISVLVTGIGGPTPRSIALILRKKFPDSRIIGVDANPKALGFFMDGLVDNYAVIPFCNANNYWETIHRIIKDEAIDLAFVQPECEVIKWGQYFKDQGCYPCPVLLPPLEYAEVLVDKGRMSQLLGDTSYIPKTVLIDPQRPDFDEIEGQLGYPFWIRATTGSGGFGSLKVESRESLEGWLRLFTKVPIFTASEFLPGRHLANQMMYINGRCVRNAGLECVNYVMADVAPSRVTGNTSYGRFINEQRVLAFCEEVMDFLSRKLNVSPHGVFSFDLKEDREGAPKVTEINVRHMAYTGIMANVGFDLVTDTIEYLNGTFRTKDSHRHIYDKPYSFLRDVDIEPIILPYLPESLGTGSSAFGEDFAEK